MGGGRSPLSPWSSFSPLLARDRLTSCVTDHTPTASLRFSPVRSTRSGLIQPVCHHHRRLSLPHLHSRPSDPVQTARCAGSSCRHRSSHHHLTPFPRFQLMREFIDILLPYITKMVNSSLAAGRLPTSQKHAIITPLLKRSGLNTSADMGNYRRLQPFIRVKGS